MLPILYDAATPEDIRNELTRHHQHTNLKSA